MPRRDGVSVITITVFRVGSDRDKTGSDAVQDRVYALPKLNLFTYPTLDTECFDADLLPPCVQVK